MAAVCFDLGSCGLQTDETETQVHILAYFPAALPLDAIHAGVRRALRDLGADCEPVVSVVAEEDWSAEWRRFFRPVWATDRIVVHPAWIPVEARPPQFAITIDPKMAFGTGGHESTRLCLRALEKFLVPGDSCLDLGVGSGILSIAALKLGAADVTALDVDPQALENARENLEVNGLEDEAVTLRQGSLDKAGSRKFDLIMANIQSSVLTPLLPGLADHSVRMVLLSGLLRAEQDGFLRQVGAAQMSVMTVLSEGEWVCVVAGPRRTRA